MNRKTLILALLIALPAAAALAQKLPALSPAAVVDGTVGANEYSLAVPLGEMTLYASRTADTLHVAVRARASGWVGFGVGSLRMDKAWIYIGYARGAEVGFIRRQGAGHRHSDVGTAPPAAHSVKEEAGFTTLELSFKLSDVVAPGQTELKCIVACSRQDNLNAMHMQRESVSLQL